MFLIKLHGISLQTNARNDRTARKKFNYKFHFQHWIFILLLLAQYIINL